MKSQKYLDSLVQDCIDRLNHTTKLQENNPELFNIDMDIDNLDDDTFERVYKVSILINDSKTAYAKLASFLDFCKQMDIELDLSVIKDVKGISGFLEGYKPFEMYSSKVGDEYEVTLPDYDQAFDLFKDSFKTFRNASRN